MSMFDEVLRYIEKTAAYLVLKDAKKHLHDASAGLRPRKYA